MVKFGGVAQILSVYVTVLMLKINSFDRLSGFQTIHDKK